MNETIFKCIITAFIETLLAVPPSYWTLGFTHLETNIKESLEFEVCPIDDHCTYGSQV